MNFEKRIQTRYDRLPEQLRSLITTNAHEVVIREITKEHGLTTQQAITLSEEVLLVLLLFLPIKGLAERLEDSLAVGSERAIAITNYLTIELFDLEAELFSETEALFAEKNNDLSHQDLEAIPSMEVLAEDKTAPHGYGAGLPPTEPTHTSTQERLVPATQDTASDSSTQENTSKE